MGVFTKEDLKRFQAESLDEKFQRTLSKVAEWYSRWNNEVYVSFSGGKDSTVLADICARWCKVIGKPLYLVFVNTGLEYPEIQKHVKAFAEWLRNKYDIEVVLEILRPQMRFDEVIKTYGYPIIGKEVSETLDQARKSLERNDGKYTYRLAKLRGEAVDKYGEKSQFNQQKYEPLLYTDFRCSANCCNVMKKKPVKQYEKTTGRKPILATMAEESRLRTQRWLKDGCNAFNAKRATSQPMSFWTEQDVLQYIKQEQIPIAPVYGEIIYEIEPDQMRLADYGIDCGTPEKLATTGCNRTGCIFCAFGCHLEKSPSRFERLKETHPRQYEYCIGGGEYGEDGLWQPSKKGLGMGHVFDELNKIYGDGFIRY